MSAQCLQQLPAPPEAEAGKAQGPASRAVSSVSWSCDGLAVAYSCGCAVTVCATGSAEPSSDPAAAAAASAEDPPPAPAPPLAQLQQVILHPDVVNAVAFSPSKASSLLTGCRDRCLRLYNARTGALLRTYRGHAKEVLSVAYAPGGLLLASAAADCNIFLWEESASTVLRRLAHHVTPVLTCAFSPPGRRLLVSGSEDGLVKARRGGHIF